VIASSRYTPSNILEETTRIAYDKRGLSWRIEGTNLTEYYEYGVKGEVLALHRYLKDDTLRDESNAVLAQVNGAYSYSYTYNDGGMITSMTNPDGSVTNYDYRDGLGFLKRHQRWPRPIRWQLCLQQVWGSDQYGLGQRGQSNLGV
jgi:YD repeat-containing protein